MKKSDLIVETYKCSNCKKDFEYLKINNTNLGFFCHECTEIISKKINQSNNNNPLSYYRNLF